MSFRIISCSTFTIWCNKHKRHLTISHYFQPFRYFTNSNLSLFLYANDVVAQKETKLLQRDIKARLNSMICVVTKELKK